jgi:hypothetical protein
MRCPDRLVVLLAAFAVLSLPMALPDRPPAKPRHLLAADAPDRPVAIDVAPDGRVWLAMASDTGSLAGAAVYTADLAFEVAWGLAGEPGDITVDGNGDVYVDEWPNDAPLSATRRVISRFTAEGRHQRSWPFPDGDALAFDGRPSAGVVALAKDDKKRRVFTFDASGATEFQWPAEWPATGVEQRVTDMAVGPTGDVFVAAPLFLVGNVFRFGPDGDAIATYAAGSMPVAVDVGTDGIIYAVGGGDMPGATVFLLHDPNGMSSWPKTGVWIDDVWSTDLAVAPGGDVYVLVEIRDPVGPDSHHEVRRYGADGRLLGSIREFRGIQGSPRPATATPGPTPTANPTDATEKPTSSAPTPTETPTVAPPTPSAGVVLMPVAVRGAGLRGD